jgi:glycosyltransferase involved in cell wall biosynthesis
MKELRQERLKICVFVNVDWFILSHFTDYLKKIVAQNFDVTVLTLNTGRCEEIRALGVTVIELDLHRGYSNLYSELKSWVEIYRTLRTLSPDVLELITIKPVLYGGLVAKILKINKTVFYMSGLGAVFTNQTNFGRAKATIVTYVYKFIMSSTSTAVIVENEDDRHVFSSKIGLAGKQINLIPGVGVDMNQFFPANRRILGNLRVALVSRLLYDKGVLEFVEAAKLCKSTRPEVEFLLVGDTDPTNPASLSQKDLEDFRGHNTVKLLGHSTDVASLMKTFDILVLPSYREGFPKVIMEAAATGLPVVTTDVTGCRSAVVHNETGLIVPSKNVEALEKSIGKLLDSPTLRSAMGANAREFAALNFDVNRLSVTHISVWN